MTSRFHGLVLFLQTLSVETLNSRTTHLVFVQCRKHNYASDAIRLRKADVERHGGDKLQSAASNMPQYPRQ
jgi:hypothetical protein